MLKPSRAHFAVPDGACDCHVHVFGPFDRFPLSERRSYTPPPAPLSELIARMDAAAITRAVIVQPSAYGTDNRCTLEAVRRHPDRLRAVAVINGRESDNVLEDMNAAGVRGIRVNVISDAGAAAGFAATLQRLASRIAPLGWHMQVYAPLASLVEHARILDALPVDLVVDHMGQPNAANGPDQPGFRVLLGLVRSGKVWVKLSGPYRTSPDSLGNAAVTAIARALVAANPDRMVWGSDWPHIGAHAGKSSGAAPPIPYRLIDYGALLSVVPHWVEADDLLRKVLVDNPARLYGL